MQSNAKMTGAWGMLGIVIRLKYDALNEGGTIVPGKAERLGVNKVGHPFYQP